MFNVFTDPKLRSRQDILDGQWNSLWAAWHACDQTPDSLFASFATDYNNWNEFYASESDWSTDSFNATNVWQAKAKEWSDQLQSWGCTGNFSQSVGTVGSNEAENPSGIPGVKSPPPDEDSSLGKIGKAVADAEKGLFSTIQTIGWVAVGLVVLLIGGLIYVLTHAKVSTPQGSIG